MIDKICKCECKKIIEPQMHHRQFGMPDYIHGHHWRNRKQSPEHIAKRQVWLGRKHTKESKKKISENHWYNSSKQKEISEKVSKARKGKLLGNQNGFKNGEQPWNAGKIGIYNKETLKIMSEKKTGENHPFWLGGKSFEPYTTDFNKHKKRMIRKRDGYMCQECNYTEKQLGYNLSIHHINYDKLNSNPENLIALCKSCHTKTNYSRDDWTEYFMERNLRGESISQS